jgi:hypothetical protein
MSTSLDESTRLIWISRIVLISIGLPMFICGTIGNLINSLAFTSLPQLNKLPSSVFLLCSFVASQINLFVGLLLQLVYRITGNDPLSTSLIICKIRWFFGPICGTVALHYISLAAINQYLITSRQVRYHYWITRRRAIYISSIVLLILIVPLSPGVVFYTHVVNSANMTVCSSAMTPIFAVYFTYISIVLYSLIPIILLSIFSLLTWFNVRNNNVLRRQGMKQALTRILLLQIIMVLLTTILNVINQIYFFYTQTIHKDSLRLAGESLVSSIFTIIGYSTHSISFYIYFSASKVFRKNIRLLFIKQQRRIQPDIRI